MQYVHYLLDVLRVAECFGLRSVTAGILHILFLRNAANNVDGYLKIHWARNSGSRVAERNRDILGYALHALDLLRKLGDRLQEGRAIEVLQAASQMVGNASVASDKNHRTWSLERVGDARYGIGDARTCRDDRHTRLAGNFCPALCGVCGDLLVPEVYDLDAFVNAALVEVIDVSAVQREYILHTLFFQCLGEQSPAVYLCHFSS